MKNYIIGIILGIIAGIIDVIPMIIQGLTWDANISAFLMWVIVGFFISVTEIKINPILKGILIAFLVFIPSAPLIGWNDQKAFIPISIMTFILGSLLGYFVNKIINKNKI